MPIASNSEKASVWNALQGTTSHNSINVCSSPPTAKNSILMNNSVHNAMMAMNLTTKPVPHLPSKSQKYIVRNMMVKNASNVLQ